MPRHRQYVDATPPAAPAHLTAAEREVFDATAAFLLGRAALGNADAHAIELYAAAVVRARRLDAILRERGETNAKGAPSSLLAVASQAHSNARSWARLLGIGPAARRDMPRDEHGDDGAGSALAKLLREPARPRKAPQ